MIASDIFFWILPIMFALFGLALWSLSRRDAMLIWARYAGAGFGLAAIAIVIDTQRSGAIANLFVLAVPMHWLVLALVGHAFIRRAGGRTPLAVHAVLTIAGSAIVAWFTLVDPQSPVRVITANLVGCGITFANALVLYRIPRGEEDGARLFATVANRWLMIATAVCYGVRTLLYFSNGQGAEFGVAPLWSQYMLLFYFTAAVTGLATGMLLLISLVLDLVDHHHRASKIDPLTGIGNRRALETIAAAHADGSAPLGALAMIDLDHFKNVNDRHGHAIGDMVLVEVARRFDRLFAGQGQVVRLGGEEFGLFIDARHAASASATVDHALASLADIRFDGRDGPFQVTASAGIAAIQAQEGVYDALRRADIGLYAAKRAGRNRMVLAPPATLDDADRGNGGGDAAALVPPVAFEAARSA
jgi:diguanylate cyclase (GGDEF)-like protein